MTRLRLPLTPSEFKQLDRDPETSAACLFDYAPKTTDALIALYCEAESADYPMGRHVETAQLSGDEL